MASYTTIDNPELFFQGKLYTGAGDSTAVTVDGDENMQPDLIWMKNRGATYDHHIYDSIRGGRYYLESSTTNGQQDLGSGNQIDFDSDGFTSNNDFNSTSKTSSTYVAWCWKAGTSFSNDASATSIGDIDSSGSVSQTAGFSICSYTGSGTSGDTIKHGLSTAPKIIIIKKTSAGDNWTMLNTNISLNTHLHFTTASAVSDPMFNNTAPTTSVFTVDSDGQVNGSGNTFIAYCFSEVQGYSKFGSYTGNGNADGPFIYTGFRPAWLLVKRASGGTQDWQLFDSKINPFNDATICLRPNQNNGDQTGNSMDLLSNGFKNRLTGSSVNTNGDTYIYMAFAEAPFVNSSGIPCNAR